MRGTVEGMASPYELASYLPGIMQEDMFAVRMTEGLDEVLAPVVATLDCLAAYVDARTAPDDFVRWLATWLGLEWGETWPTEQLRTAVVEVGASYADRGTLAGLRRYLELVVGGTVEVADNGGVAWSRTPGGEFPGEETPRLAVRVTVEPTSWFPGERLLDELVSAHKPAHVRHRVELVTAGPR